MRLVLIVLFAFASMPAQADSRLGNGGDYLAAEFFARAARIISSLDGSQRHDLTDDEIRGMRLALSRTIVTSTDDRLIDRNSKREVDAAMVIDANGQQSILLNRKRIQYAYDHVELFDRMVFHELLHLIGISDYLYRRSARQFPSTESYDPPRIEEISPPAFEGRARPLHCKVVDNDGDTYGETLRAQLYDNAIELLNARVKGDVGYIDQAASSQNTLVFRGFRQIGGGDASTAVIVRRPRNLKSQPILLQISGSFDQPNTYRCKVL